MISNLSASPSRWEHAIVCTTKQCSSCTFLSPSPPQNPVRCFLFVFTQKMPSALSDLSNHFSKGLWSLQAGPGIACGGWRKSEFSREKVELMVSLTGMHYSSSPLLPLSVPVGLEKCALWINNMLFQVGLMAKGMDFGLPGLVLLCFQRLVCIALTRFAFLSL